MNFENPGASGVAPQEEEKPRPSQDDIQKKSALLEQWRDKDPERLEEIVGQLEDWSEGNIVDSDWDTLNSTYAGWVQEDSFLVETARGPLGARILGKWMVRVDVGEVTLGRELSLHGVAVATASVGNPHAVLDVVEVRTAPVEELGSRLEADPTFPEGTNVEFMTVTDAGIELRVWERGVGETLACGSGAAAAAAVAIAQGKATSPVTVLLPGGQLIVDVGGGRAHLTGPVEVVFTGSISLS